VAVLAGLVTAYGVIMGRYEMIEEPAAFTLLCGGLSGAFLALCLGVWAMVSTWVRVVRGFRYAAGATVLSLALLAVPTSFQVPGLARPAIHDISTDLSDPPLFTVSALTRPDWANDITPAPPDSDIAAAQREAYPEIVPLVLDMQPEEGFDFAGRAARELGWEVTARLAPPLPDVEGQIEAVARTDILRFADDVVIRVRPHEDGTRFDVRSVSRFGRSDLGRNGARIRQVLDLIELYSEE
jgi:hypothetical protein